MSSQKIPSKQQECKKVCIKHEKNKNYDYVKQLNTSKLALPQKNQPRMIINRPSNRKVSIKLDRQQSQLQNSLFFPKNNQIPSSKDFLLKCQFSETVQNISSKNKNQKAIWISRRGAINFYLMENQDHIIALQKSENCKIYGILDGNGKYGKIVAEDMGNRLVNYLIHLKEGNQKAHKIKAQSNTNTMKHPKHGFEKKISSVGSSKIESEEIKNLEVDEEPFIKKIIKFIEKQNVKMMKDFPQDYKSSGCTLLFVIIFKKKIFTFSIGSSKSLMFRSIVHKDSLKLTSFPINTEQTLSRFDEKARILSCSEALIERSVDENNCRIGPERIWKKGQKYPGLSITRCLGMQPEMLNKLGIISAPQCLVIDIHDNFEFILLGSDGFWKVFDSSQEVLNIINQFWLKKKMDQGLEFLLNEAVIRWNKRYELMDDISIMLIRIH